MKDLMRFQAGRMKNCFSAPGKKLHKEKDAYRFPRFAGNCGNAAQAGGLMGNFREF